MVKKIFYFFISWKILAFFFLFLASLFIPLDWTFTLPKKSFFEFTHDYFFESKAPYFIWVWGNFDGFYYLNIARYGYIESHAPFFPLYPIFIWLFSSTFKVPYILSSLVVSNASFFLAMLISVRTLLIDKKKKLINLFLLIMILFPTSFYYGAVYNDSIFLLFATLTLYFGRKKAWFLAGITGGLATLARLNGLALFFYLLVEYVLAKKYSINDFMRIVKIRSIVSDFIKEKMHSIFLIPLSLLSYLVFIEARLNDWNLLFSSMKVWNQDKMVFPLQVFWRYLKIVISPKPHLNYYVAIFELLFVLVYIFLIIYSYKKIRFSYWIFFALSILIPSLTGTFQGMPRYGLHLYPLFLSVSLFLERKNRVFIISYFIISLILLFLFLSLFARGYFIA